MQTHFQHGPQIVERFMSRGPSAAVYPGLWDSSLVLATLAQPWGGLQARDFSGRNNHGDVVGGEWGYGTYRGGAFRQVTFDGTDDYVNLVASSILIPAENAKFSVSLWLNPSAIGAASYANRALTINRAETTSSLIIGVEESNKLFAYYGGVGGSKRQFATVAIGTWYQMVHTYDGTNHRLYLNGTLADTYEHVLYAGSASYDSSLSTNATKNGNWFSGLLADARIYSRALSPAEIRLFTHPLAAYETRINRYWMFTSGGVAPAPEWVAIPRYGLAAAGLPKYALPRAGSSTASTIALPTLSIVV